jgi:hypothetical protein
MLRKLSRRPSHATVVAYLALFVALGGTSAYAVNEWTGANIVDESLTGRDVLDNTLASADITNQSLTGTDIADFGVKKLDIASNDIDTVHIQNHTIQSIDIANFALNDEDIGQGTFVDFQANIGSVPAHSCRYGPVTGVNATRDHLVLTPNFNTTSSLLVYGIEYESSREQADIKVCNPTDSAINDGITRFNLLVIDAQ